MKISIDLEELHDNVADWFSMNFIQSEYDSDNDYVDDLMGLISYINDGVIDLCIKDITNKYYSCYTEDQIDCYRDSITDFISYEAKLALNNLDHSVT